MKNTQNLALKKDAKIKNQLNFRWKPEYGETFIGKSQTVPDETLTMREIITRFSRTGQVDSRLDRKGLYTDNPNYDSPDLEELQRLDPYERQERAAELKLENQEKLDRIKQSILDKEKEEKAKLSSSKSKEAGPAATKNVPESSERANESTKQGTKRGDKGANASE